MIKLAQNTVYNVVQHMEANRQKLQIIQENISGWYINNSDISMVHNGSLYLLLKPKFKTNVLKSKYGLKPFLKLSLV